MFLIYLYNVIYIPLQLVFKDISYNSSIFVLGWEILSSCVLALHAKNEKNRKILVNFFFKLIIMSIDIFLYLF